VIPDRTLRALLSSSASTVVLNRMRFMPSLCHEVRSCSALRPTLTVEIATATPRDASRFMTTSMAGSAEHVGVEKTPRCGLSAEHILFQYVGETGCLVSALPGICGRTWPPSASAAKGLQPPGGIRHDDVLRSEYLCKFTFRPTWGPFIAVNTRSVRRAEPLPTKPARPGCRRQQAYDDELGVCGRIAPPAFKRDRGGTQLGHAVDENQRSPLIPNQCLSTERRSSMSGVGADDAHAT
jgi:hypothetical protein